MAGGRLFLDVVDDDLGLRPLVFGENNLAGFGLDLFAALDGLEVVAAGEGGLLFVVIIEPGQAVV